MSFVNNNNNNIDEGQGFLFPICHFRYFYDLVVFLTENINARSRSDVIKKKKLPTSPHPPFHLTPPPLVT